MEAFNHVSDMYDFALKPRLLCTLIKDHLPHDEKKKNNHPSQLSRVTSMITTHRLLSPESFTHHMPQKQIQPWKSAVDSWVDGILTLISSDMPDKCWAGVSLLGFTCQQCSSTRFLESYSEWFEKLLHLLQSPASSHFVRVASVASTSDLFTRLSGFPTVKKEGSSLAAKVVQPLLKLLNDDNSEVIWEGGLHLLCTIVTSFPFAVQRNYDSVESAVALKLMSGGCSPYLLKKLAYSLALLPKTRGDAESWFVLMQKILIMINDQLNHSFQGLEEESRRHEFVKLLVQPGKDPPSTLGGYVSSEKASYKATKKSQQSSIFVVSTLLHCCCTMLTNQYPFKVSVPVHILLALVDRVLMVNGSLPQMSMPFVTAKQQENICSELPVLHSYGLELLTAVVKGVGSQLLPHASFIARMVTMYFKTCALPELRIKVYSITKILLISMGVGMALCLAQEVVNNAFIDLSTIRNKSPGASTLSNSNAPTKKLLQPKSRKRKHKSMTGSLQQQEHDEVSVSAADAPKNYLVTPMSLRIAALEALEVLITVAGSLKSEPWRSEVDNLLIVIASDSFEEEWISEEINTFEQKESAATSADLQLSALRALLACFLSFSQARSPHLALGLQLFHRGKRLIGTKLSEFCAHALLALEVLILPSALPLVDDSAIHDSSGKAHSNSRDGHAIDRNKSNPFGSQQVGYDTPESDDLCQNLLEDGSEPDLPLAKEGTKQPKEPSRISRENDPKLYTVHHTTGTKKPDRSEKMPETATCADIEMTADEDENVTRSDRPVEYAMQLQDPRYVVVESVSENIVPDNKVPPHTGNGMESIQEASISKYSESANLSNQMPMTSDLTRDQGFAPKLHHDDTSDSDDGDLPDIVDGDPDSDSS